MNTAHTTTADTLLSEVFQHHSNHALTVLEDEKVVGVIQMRDFLMASVQYDSLDGLLVSDYMIEDVISIEHTQNNLHIARKFANHKIKSLIMTDHGVYTGCLEPQDVIIGLPSSLLGFFQAANQNMIVNPYTVSPQTLVKEAISLMARCRISCLPVVDDAGKALGMFSESDAVRCVYQTQTELSVGEVMTKPALTCASDASLRQCWDLMLETKVMKLLMVHADGRLHGLLTVTDVLVGLCRSLLSTFQVYHCPDTADMMLEWRKSGMIMAVSEGVHARLGYTAEELVGLTWQQGCLKEDMKALLALPKGASHAFLWALEGAALPFVATRDSEQACMFWRLDA
ncbi:MAG: CBS domain-containing protein [Mariprofundaceae bacterium]|nr:CBS domain-containing protein [Mariprofundaceae bacterium]